MKKIIYLIAGFFTLPISAQSIQMEFPYFKGNSYDFVIFQGSETVKVLENVVIPENGTFILNVPEQYKPYTGMGRWLLTNSSEGGGLEMFIPGYDFSVSCTEAMPNQDNIIFRNNDEFSEINKFYQKQQNIFAKHDAMLQATQVFSKSDSNYKIFEDEYQKQLTAYESYQQELQTKNNYAAQYINFINVLQGVGTKIFKDENQKAVNIAEYTLHHLDWNALYTSGHWSGVIATWVSMYADFFNDKLKFAQDFNTISNKINTTKQYKDFVKTITKQLTSLGKDDFIKEITPIVVSSEKIDKYDEVLSVYVSAKEDEIAPSLVFSDHKVVQSKDFTNGNFEKTLVVFYQSECGNCNELMNELKENYKLFTDKKIRIISVSSDNDVNTFNDYASSFPWKDVIYDGELQNINFANYGVVGTPTLFLLDKEGKIELRGATLDEVKQKM